MFVLNANEMSLPYCTLEKNDARRIGEGDWLDIAEYNEGIKEEKPKNMT